MVFNVLKGLRKYKVFAFSTNSSLSISLKCKLKIDVHSLSISLKCKIGFHCEYKFQQVLLLSINFFK